jgi:xylulokinase
MYIGIDIGTSGVKTVLLNEVGNVVDSHTSPLTVSRPKSLWSEQDPNDWWIATVDGLKHLAIKNNLHEVKAIGLTGQMHGAVLLDEHGNVLRPAILWNDGRSFEECQELEAKVESIHSICGNLIMPGFTAPKLLWVAKNEPEIFSKISMILLPKDYIRYK